MKTALKIGDRVCVATTTEALVLVSIDGDDAFLRYDEGGHKVERLEDLEKARSDAWYQIKGEYSPAVDLINNDIINGRPVFGERA